MENFISLFLRMLCHLKYFETINETTPKIYDFILKFNNIKFYVVSLVVYVMKWNLMIPMLISRGFNFLEIVYTQFHVDETLLLSVVIYKFFVIS
jgi:hypothetical protein